MAAQTCQGCRDGTGFDTAFTMAFQPIVHSQSRRVFAVSLYPAASVYK